MRRLRWLLLLATAMFVTGIFLPMLTISKFVLITNSFSLAAGINELLQDGHLLLFLVVAGFSLILPLLKIQVLFRVLSAGTDASPRIRHSLHLMHRYGRWAMLDVLVVALLVVTVKLGAIASIEVHYGLYVFAASVLLIMLITNRVISMTGKAPEPPASAR